MFRRRPHYLPLLAALPALAAVRCSADPQTASPSGDGDSMAEAAGSSTRSAAGGGDDGAAALGDAGPGPGGDATGAGRAADATVDTAPADMPDVAASADGAAPIDGSGVAVADSAGPADSPGPEDAPTRAPDSAAVDGGVAGARVKPRVIVTTDIGFDPDDEESLVRYLVYSNEFDTEALIAVTSLYVRTNPREDLIRQEVAAYGQARSNLAIHAAGFPDPASLLAVTKTGQPGYGLAFVGPGKSSAGSQQLIAAVDKPDPRPVWVTGWGGMNTLAQALQDVSASRTAAEVARFVGKLRVYTISDQDDAGAWIRRTYPQLFYVVSPSPQNATTYARATWSGISGDRWYMNGPMEHFDLVDNPWLQANIIANHGPLGAVYPRFKYIMEGDTPSYFGLIDNGLGWATSPSYGGWGGRYALLQPAGETRPIWTNDGMTTRDTVTIGDGGTATSDQATIWRWRAQYQYDFAARMNWCVADQYAKANHNPIAVLDGDTTTDVVTIAAKGGSSISLSAAGTTDPDGDPVRVTWWIYREAGTISGSATLSAAQGLSTQVNVPVVASPGTVHVILQAEDSRTPPLTAYRRAILDVQP